MANDVYTPSPWGVEYHNLDTDEALGGGSAGPGKALSLNTLIPTPSGLTPLGAIRPGDKVFDENGSVCNVVAESMVWHGRPCRRIRFDDGAEIVADAEHEWLTIDYRARASLRNQEKKKRNRLSKYSRDQRSLCVKPKIRTTSEIAASMLSRGRVNHAVMLSLPTDVEDKNFPLDPYVLGAWLGDGTTTAGQITSADREIIDNIESCGFRCRKLGAKYLWGVPGLSKELRKIGVLGNKHIPVAYMTASVRQRMNLLQGIIDTDGHIDRDGRVELTLCNESLSRDCYRLICSLGFKVTIRESDAKLNGRTVGRRWRMGFSPMGRPVSRLSRKVSKIGNGVRTQRWRYVVSVEPIASEPVKCIQVDSPSHLFLAGEAHVPTHNSLVLLMDPLAQIQVEHKRCQLNRDHPYYHPWGMSVGKALHLRRTMPMLSETISRAKRMFFQLDPQVKWNETNHTFTFASGYQYQFGHCKDSDAWMQYFSNEYTHLAFDEVSQFEEEQYKNIHTRVRTVDPVLRGMLKTRCMSNPVLKFDSSDAVTVKNPYWVRDYYVEPCREGRKVLRERREMQDGTIEYETRIFLPATLYDNPDKEFVRQYEKRLQGAAPHMRAALLFGDWYVTHGAFFSEYWNPSIHTCQGFKVPTEWARFRSMDWGFRAPGCIHWYALSPEGTLFVEKELTFQGKTPPEVAKAVKLIEEQRGLWDHKHNRSRITGPADTQLWEQRGDTGKSKAEEFKACGIAWTKADKRSRQRNAERVVARLKDHDNGTKEPGVIIFNECRNLLKTLPAIPTDPSNSECPMDTANDHWCDSFFYGVAYASRDRSPPVLDDEDDFEERRPKKKLGRWGYGT